MALQFSPFGGLGLPRYLIYTLPFVAVGLSVTYRRFPVTTAALAVVSIFQMTVMTATSRSRPTTSTGSGASRDGRSRKRVRSSSA